VNRILKYTCLERWRRGRWGGFVRAPSKRHSNTHYTSEVVGRKREMQRSLSLSTELRIKNPSELDDDDDDDSREFSKREEQEDMDLDSDSEKGKRSSMADANYSPRKVVAEEVATFERSANISANGGKPLQSGKNLKLEIDTRDAQASQEGLEPDANAVALEANYIMIRRAILEGKLDDVKTLVSKLGNDERVDLVNHVSGKDNFSPLMVAVSCDADKVDEELVRYLLENGARKDVVDRKGNTCIHWAAVQDQAALLKLLIDNKEDVALQNNAGDTPLHLASRSGKVSCCDVMLELFHSAEASDGDANAPNDQAKDSVKEEPKEKPKEGAAVQANDAQIKEDDGSGKPTLEQEQTAPVVDKAEASMNALLAQKVKEEDAASSKAKAAAELTARRQKDKSTTLSLLVESSQNDQPPPKELLLRNAEFQTAFDVAGSEISMDNVGSGTPAMVKAARIKHAEDTRKAIRNLFCRVSPFFKTLVLHHADCFDHIPYGEEGGRDIWEAPERLTAILQGISKDVDPESVTVSSDFEKASQDMLKRAHSDAYVDFVCNLEAEMRTAPVPFTPLIQRKVLNFEEKDLKKNEHCDTSFSPGSLRAALSACGAVCHAIDRVVGGLSRNSFCVVRPPGHHAGISGLLESASSCGFCIFNNVMVGALHSLAKFPDTIKSVAIVDVDVHHGNGTEEIVAKFNREAMEEQRRQGKSPKPPILFFSSHVFDAARSGTTTSYEFYPGSGQYNDPTGNIINAPMQPLWRRRGYRKNIDGRRSWAERFYFDHFGRQEFRRIIKERLSPALRTFSPDLVLISAGFDAGRRDVGNGRFLGKYCSGFDLQQQDFMWVAAQVSRVAQVCCEGRVVSVLEGGYGKPESLEAAQSLHIDRSSLARNCVAHVLGLVDQYAKLNEDEDLTDESDEEKQDQDTEEKLNSRRTRTRRPPKRFEGQPEGSRSSNRRTRRRGESSGESEEDTSSTAKSRKRKKPNVEKAAQAQKRDQALRYLRRVKTQFSEEPEVYKQFLVIMGKFKHGSIGVAKVIQEVKTLFQGDRELIEGFNAFLPPGFYVTYTDEDRIAKELADQRQAKSQGVIAILPTAQSESTAVGLSEKAPAATPVPAQTSSPTPSSAQALDVPKPHISMDAPSTSTSPASTSLAATFSSMAPVQVSAPEPALESMPDSAPVPASTSVPTPMPVTNTTSALNGTQAEAPALSAPATSASAISAMFPQHLPPVPGLDLPPRTSGLKYRAYPHQSSSNEKNDDSSEDKRAHMPDPPPPVANDDNTNNP